MDEHVISCETCASTVPQSELRYWWKLPDGHYKFFCSCECCYCWTAANVTDEEDESEL